MHSRNPGPQSPGTPIRVRLYRAFNQSIEHTSIISAPFLDLINRSPPTILLDRSRSLLVAVPRALCQSGDVNARPPGNIQGIGARSSHDADRLNTVVEPSGTTSISGATTRPSATTL